jgi:hypothetical protein
MSIIVTDSVEHNGVIYNAKGDLGLNGTVFANDVTPSPGLAFANVIFNSDGTITQVGNNGAGTATQWVETGAGWQGGSNYTISWTAIGFPGPGVIASPSSNGSATLGSNRSFSLSTSTDDTIGTFTYNITITNDAAGTQTPESINFLFQLDVEVLGGGGGI